MSDKQLRQDIVEELEFEPRIDAANIGVTAKNGVVSLSGHVSSYAEKQAVCEAARRIKGVRAVADEIEVRYPSEKRTADDEIARRGADILRWSEAAPPDAVTLTVREGRVTLTGQVNWQFEKNAAEDQIRKLSGVVGIINNITIKPRLQPTDVKRKIEDALKRNVEIEAEAISVHVLDGGKITLDGRVHSWQEKMAVENAAWSAPGVIAVDNRLALG